MSTTGIIFDLDGTLVDSGADIAAAANAARTGLGLPPLPAEVAISYVGDGVGRLLERVLSHDLAAGTADGKVAAPLLAAGLAHFRAHYERHLLDRTRLYPGIDALLAALNDRRLFIATNKPRDFSLAILNGLGIAARFERVTAGDDPPARKPDPAHLATCLQGTGLGAGDVVMVGDGPHDVLAARAFGCASIGVAWGLVERARLEAARPDVIVDNTAALARILKVSP